MKKCLLILFLLISSVSGVKSQEPQKEFDGSYTIIVSNPKEMNYKVTSDDLNVIERSRKESERVEVKINGLSCLILSKEEVSKGYKTPKYTLRSN